MSANLVKIWDAAKSAQERLNCVDAHLCMIDRGSVESSEPGTPTASVILEYVRDACSGIRMVLSDVATDVEAVLEEAKKEVGGK